jgi:hypothetical protein
MNWPLCAGDYAAERRLEVRSSREGGRRFAGENPQFETRRSPGIRFWDGVPRQFAKSLKLIASIEVTPLFTLQKMAGTR